MSNTSPSGTAEEALIHQPDDTHRQKYLRKGQNGKLVGLVAGVFTLVALAILIFSCVFVSTPGPGFVYSHFAALSMACCLIFQCGQLMIARHECKEEASRTKGIFRLLYWAVVALSTFIAGVGWAVSGKPDAAAVQFLAFTVGLIGVALHLYSRSSHVQNGILPRRRWFVRTARGFNWFFRFIHLFISILFAVGAILLALQFRYTNPGQIYDVSLGDGRTVTLSVYCTGPPSVSVPTLWFDTTPAHGVTDFLGVQTYLSINHGRHSCSYDQLNFGWSGRALVGVTNSSAYWSSMLKALGRQDEPYIGVGWGGGAENVLSHAIESPSTTKGVVFVDASPDGIEWMTTAWQQGWDEAKMLEFRQQDLAGRISLVRIILALAIPWGIISVFVPYKPSDYFDQSLYARHHAQGLKDDFWAIQYYSLIDMRAQRNVSTYLTETLLPPSIPAYTIITNNSKSTSERFALDIKVNMVDHIAGGKDKVKGRAWCTDADCDLGFPVTKARWTADALVALGI